MGHQTFSPDELRASTRPLLTWLAATGCSRVAIHFDVDTVDSNEGQGGRGRAPVAGPGTTVDAGPMPWDADLADQVLADAARLGGSRFVATVRADAHAVADERRPCRCSGHHTWECTVELADGRECRAQRVAPEPGEGCRPVRAW